MAKTITINLGDLYEKAMRRANKYNGFSDYIRSLIEEDLKHE